MTYFLRSGNRYHAVAHEAINMTETLPGGTYTVKFDELTGQYHLEMARGYEVPSKLYGDTERNAERILTTFGQRDNSTGVLLTGEQGSGKTMLAKLLSVKAVEQGIPTFLINEAFFGDTFNAFIQQFTQPVVIIFDEFEKVYDTKEQEQMLTLLDGLYPSKKLFVLTCNSQYRINEHMKNRPGRLYYRLDYTGLDADFIREYCEDNLENKGHIDTIVRLAAVFTAFNFDILKAMVEEMNRYGETPQEVIQFLNASPEYSEHAEFSVRLWVNNQEIVGKERLRTDRWNGNPMDTTTKIAVYFYGPDKDEDGDLEYHSIGLNFSHLKDIDPNGNEFTFAAGKYKVALKRLPKAKHDWNAF